MTCVSKIETNIICKIQLRSIDHDNSDGQYYQEKFECKCHQSYPSTFHVKSAQIISIFFFLSHSSFDFITHLTTLTQITPHLQSRRVYDQVGSTRPQNTPLPATRSAAVMMKRGTGEIFINSTRCMSLSPFNPKKLNLRMAGTKNCLILSVFPNNMECSEMWCISCETNVKNQRRIPVKKRFAYWEFCCTYWEKVWMWKHLCWPPRQEKFNSKNLQTHCTC